MHKMNEMKKKFIYLLITVGCLLQACAKKQFEDKVLPLVNVGFNYGGNRLTVDSDKSFTKTGDVITVPVEVAFTSSAATLFTINIASRPDTISKMIASQVMQDAVALPETAYNFPGTMDVRFGLTRIPVNVQMTVSDLERFYGKNVAFALEISNVTKGNLINQDKKTVIVIVDTKKIINIEEVHYLSIKESGSYININGGLNYSQTDDYISVPFNVVLSGSVGPALTAGLLLDADTARKIVANGSVANAVAIDAAALDLSPGGSIAANDNLGQGMLRIRTAEVARYFGKNLVIGIRLNNPSKYQVDPDKGTVVVIMNTLSSVKNITGLLKNTTRPFQSTVWDKRRWGILDDWITTNPVINQKQGPNTSGYTEGTFGGYDRNNNTNIAMQSGYTTPPAPNVTNGKIYQTVSLPAGKYRVTATSVLSSGTTSSQAFYVVAASGTGLPDIPSFSSAPAPTLGNIRVTSNKVNEFNFSVNTAGPVSIGFVGTISGSTAFNISDVKLYNAL